MIEFDVEKDHISLSHAMWTRIFDLTHKLHHCGYQNDVIWMKLSDIWQNSIVSGHTEFYQILKILTCKYLPGKSVAFLMLSGVNEIYLEPGDTICTSAKASR